MWLNWMVRVLCPVVMRPRSRDMGPQLRDMITWFRDMRSCMCAFMNVPALFKCFKLKHALNTATKVNLSRVMPFCCISWKSSMVVSWSLASTYLASHLFHENMSKSIVPGGKAASFSPTRGGFCTSPSHSAPYAFLCLKSGHLTLFSQVYNPITEKDRKKIPAKVSFSRVMLSLQLFHPKKLLSLYGYKPLDILTMGSRG
jgi:hypothetical protein